MSQRFSFVAAYAFKRKYSKHRIVITDNFSHPDESVLPELNIAGIKINLQAASQAVSQTLSQIGFGKDAKRAIIYHENEHNIEITNYRTILTTFKYFGHVISKLKLIYSNTACLQAKFMGELIGNFSSNSLHDVQFDYCKDKTLEFITQPLTNVKKVTFGESFHDVGNDTMPVNELFPAIESLHLEAWGASFDYLEQHMPNLKHYTITYSFTNVQSLGRIIRQNKQIQSVELFRTKHHFLQTLSDLLQNLKHLKLWYFDFENMDNIVFKSVTTLSVDSSLYSPQNMYFPKLQNLSLQFRARNFERLRTFLEEHKMLKQLRLISFDLNDELFDGILEQLTNLKELTLRRLRGRAISAECVRRLLGRRELQQFDLCLGSEAEQNGFRRKFEMVDFEWSIEIIGGCLSFQRKEE